MIGCHNFVELLKYSRKVQNGNRFTELNNSLSRIEGLILESEAEMEITHKLQYLFLEIKFQFLNNPPINVILHLNKHLFHTTFSLKYRLTTLM